MSGATLSRRLSEFFGVALFAAALIWLIALTTYEPTDPVWFFSTGGEAAPVNFVGRVGAFLAELSFQLLGYASFLIPASLVRHRLALFLVPRAGRRLHEGGGRQPGVRGRERVLEPGLRTDRCLDTLVPRGRLPRRLARRDAVRLPESHRLDHRHSDGALLWRSFCRPSFRSAASSRLVVHGLAATWSGARRAFGDWREERRREQQRREVIAKHTRRAGGQPNDGPPVVSVKMPPTPTEAPPRPARDAPPAATVQAAAPKRSRPPVVTPPLPLDLEPPPSSTPVERRLAGAYALPPQSLLDSPRIEHKIDERELMENARLLEEKCREFAVEGAVVQIHPGPVVTTFEFKPDAGVKYSKITGLADDLSLAMQAESVLIDRIPGKSTVGIQIPNRSREPISLRELLESELYRRATSKLTLALGKTIHGEPFVTDLATMPHLLIAGSTGAGKSVALNAMLTSILYRATPEEVRLIMIDPKRLELGVYEDIPHLLTPVVVDPKQAANALRWAVREMEERYKTLAAEGVRNIEQFNRNARQPLEESAA